MAFKREEQRIIPGGVNLLPPGDQVAENDCLQLVNFRPDSAGMLTQMFGLTAQTGDEGTYEMDSLLRIGAERYYGGAGGLWKATVRGVPDPPGAIDTAYDGKPLGISGFQNFVWVINRNKQRKVKAGTATPYNWTTETPTIPGGALVAGGSLADGVYDYYVTFDTADGHEGDLSPVRTMTTGGGNNTVTITRPAATEAIVTGWHVYRRGPGHSVPYRVNISAIAYAVGTLTDDGTGDKAADVIQERDQEHLGDHQAAPPATVIADKPYDGRLLVANSAAHPNRVWFSPSLEPWYFPGSDNPQDGNWVDIGEDDAVLAMTVKPGMVLVYKERTIWRVRGDIADGMIELIAPDIGTVGYRSVCATSGGDYIVGREGLYACTGDFARKLPWSTKLDTIFREQAVPIAHGISQVGIDPLYRSRCAIGHRNGRLWFSYPSTASGSHRPDSTFIVDVATGRIVSRASSAMVGSGWNCFYDEGQSGDFLGARSGAFDALEASVWGDDGNAVGLAFHSAYMDQGAPGNQKTYADLEIRHNTRGAVLVVKAFLNNGRLSTDEVALATITSTSETRSVIPLVYPATWPVITKRGQPTDPAYNIAVRIEGDTAFGAVLPVEIYSPILLHYFVHPRRSKTFDSDETDHGTPEVKAVDQLELDLDNPDATATIQIYSNIPGGVMLPRLAAAPVPKTTGRQMLMIPLLGHVNGRLLRYTLVSNATGANEGFLLYGLRARLYRTGEYLDGSNGEKWEPIPLKLGV